MKARRPTRKVLFSILIVAIVAAVTGTGTYAAFSGTTSNPSNAFAAGTVALSDNDAGGSLLSLSNATPGNSSTGCIKITYSGSLNANVHLYGSATASLPTYLTLTVTRGTDSSPSFASCSNFTADATNYIGSGAGVIYSGNLSAFPSTYGGGVVDPTSGSPATWSTSDAHSYKFVVTVQNNAAAQGLSSTASFTWEARNV
jgi:predicted ribosomally synthesized peptide with SipW-like signal peptide